LDGELWTERNDFEKCVSIVKRQDENDEWKEVKFMVFDTLEMKGKPFSQRLERILDEVNKLKTPFVEVLEHTMCLSREHLIKEMDKVIASGGEGVMLRQPDSKYE
jgi:DNA ligase-1